MNKFLLPLLTLMAMPVVLTACSDDDDKTPTVNITTGQIPSKNVFVTIDGKYIGSADGVTEITGNIDPASTEQHLQLKCPSMFILTGGTDVPWVKLVPTFNVTVTTLNGQTTLNGSYADSGYEIDVTGEVTVNYAGENDWKLYFEQKQSIFNENIFRGKTFEFDFTKDYIFALDPEKTNAWIDERGEEYYGKEIINGFFDKLSPAFVSNSGIAAARLIFSDETYELWFKDEKTGEYVKDESEHRYLATGTKVCLIDEPAFKKKQAEFFNLKPMGLNYTNTPMNFAQQTLAYEPGSAKEWCLTTLIGYTTTGRGKLVMVLQGSENNFFSNWEKLTDTETAADVEFSQLQKLEKEETLKFYPGVRFEQVN